MKFDLRHLPRWRGYPKGGGGLCETNQKAEYGKVVGIMEICFNVLQHLFLQLNR